MPEKFTTDELVELAVLCGYKAYELNGRVYYERPSAIENMPPHTGEWNPADKENAAQRDEVVEALRKDEWRVQTTVWPDGKARTELISDYRNMLLHSPMCDTPGEAVCRAALGVIKKGEK